MTTTDATLARLTAAYPVDVVGATDERAAGHDVTPGHERLHRYWTKGKGLSEWIGSDHQFATLRDLLIEHAHFTLDRANRTAATWVHEVTGNWPGSDAHRVAQGHPPRGHKIGPG